MVYEHFFLLCRSLLNELFQVILIVLMKDIPDLFRYRLYQFLEVLLASMRMKSISTKQKVTMLAREGVDLTEETVFLTLFGVLRMNIYDLLRKNSSSTRILSRLEEIKVNEEDFLLNIELFTSCIQLKNLPNFQHYTIKISTDLPPDNFECSQVQNFSIFVKLISS